MIFFAAGMPASSISSARMPPTVASASFTLGPPKAKENMSELPAMNSSALRTTLGTSTGLTSASVRPALASIARTVLSMLRMAE